MGSEIGKSEIVTRKAARGKAVMMNTQCEILFRKKVQLRAKGMKDFNNSAFKGGYRKGSQKGQNN